VGGTKTGTIHIRFYAELGDVLPAEWRARDVERAYAPGQTVKDLIEAMGVPHTEVDLILVGGRSVDFRCQLQDGDRISVYPVFEALDISAASLVRPFPLRCTRFVADVHLGRLARYLRLLGFDTVYRNDWTDDHLVEAALSDLRIILTRDRGLLKRSAVDHGYLLRHTDPTGQLAEVVERFDLGDSLRPLTRCPVCNGIVGQVAKEEIIGRLPPRTAQYYDEFWRCEECGRLYWKGGHHRSLEALVRSVAAASGGSRAPRPCDTLCTAP
jgi:uncharacterized protein with PIN domain